MVVDYDLVVLGATLEAREAAWLAVREGARVALVATAGDFETACRGALTGEILATAAQQRSEDPFSQEPPATDWSYLRRRLTLVGGLLPAHLSRSQLSQLGVDVVMADCQFSPRPHLAVTTAERRLVARAYLIACGGDYRRPDIPGLEQVPWLTPKTLLELEDQPRRVIVLGRGGDAIATAQSLARLGSEVTLMTRGQSLLPDQDDDVAQIAVALLTAAGVRVQLQTSIKTIQQQLETVIIATDQAIWEADRLLVATGQVPRLRFLNLERLHLQPDPLGLAVDEHLRTNHPRIYACGAVLGSARDARLARYEAQVAVHNALYLPRRVVQYRSVPGAIATVPAIAWVGLTENQARQWYGSAAQAYTLPLSGSLKVHLQGDTTGFCKLIIHRNGTLLGGHWVGLQAGEIMQTLALMMQQNVRCQHLDQFPALPHSLIELLREAAQQWQNQRWRPGCWRRDWAENWFNWRRSSQ